MHRNFARVGLVALTFVVSACRADSIMLPEQATSCAEPGCRPSFAAPVDAVVFAAIDDARERIVLALDDAADRQTLSRALDGLYESLKANRTADARLLLSGIYARLDRMRIQAPGSDPVDLPDVAALRLALVPVTNALGVTVS